MLLKKKGEQVSLLYHLDDNDKKIRDITIVSKQPMFDIKGNPAYKMAVCQNDNLIPVVAELLRCDASVSMEKNTPTKVF
jgi:hypothetical protein